MAPGELWQPPGRRRSSACSDGFWFALHAAVPASATLPYFYQCCRLPRSARSACSVGKGRQIAAVALQHAKDGGR